MKKIILAMVFSLSSVGALANVNADNPFGLVYDNAIVANQKGKVNIHPVKYVAHGIDVVANVYTPANFDINKKYKAIVVAHPNGGVKEQVAGLYAQKLAENGYVAIAFDAAFQGGSGGEPRNTDIPSSRIADIRAAADFIQNYKGVDPNEVALLGICGGGGYSIAAAATDKRFKAVATIAMFNSGRVRRNGYLDNQVDKIQERLADASKAQQEYVLTGKVAYFPAPDPNMPNSEIDKITTDLYREGMYYYLKDYSHPNSTFAYTKASLIELMNFDSEDHANLINQPLLMITGSKADSKYLTDAVFEKAIGTNNKEKFVVDGATHISLYYKEPYVKQVLTKLLDFYNNNLK